MATQHPKKLVTPFVLLSGIVTQSVAVSVAVGAGLGVLLGLIYPQLATKDD